MELRLTMPDVDKFALNFKGVRELLEKEMNLALKHSIAMAGTEIQKRTPVAQIATSGYVGGYLRSSIGGEGGYSFVQGLSAGIGTNVIYAFYQEKGDSFRHVTGEAHYTEKGFEAAKPYIVDEFDKAMVRLAEDLVDKK